MADAGFAPDPGPPQIITLLQIIRVVTVDMLILAGRTVLHRDPVVAPGVTITINPGGELLIL